MLKWETNELKLLHHNLIYFIERKEKKLLKMVLLCVLFKIKMKKIIALNINELQVS